MKALQRKNRALELKIKRLQTNLEAKSESESVAIDDETSLDLEKVMIEEEMDIICKFREDSFQAIFWKCQKEALARDKQAKKGMRWHPLFIKWFLYLRHLSGKAYDTLRESGCISLLSQRTLRDYSHAVKASAGFSDEVDRQLLDGAKLLSSPTYHSIVCILIDEMHIKEDLVYEKHSGRLVGFVDIGDINNHLTKFEQSLDGDGTKAAKLMVVFMVKGLFSNLSFPFAQFPCFKLAGEQLFNLF